MGDLKAKLVAEHQDIYKELERLLLAITKVKNQPDNIYLLEQVSVLLAYVGGLLADHFTIEEREFFPLVEPQDLVIRLIQDHEEIRTKHTALLSVYYDLASLSSIELTKLDLTSELLYPAYNLIATINHHAQREDSIIDTDVSIIRS